MLLNTPTPKLETALALSANIPGAARYIIQSVTFIVASKMLSNKDTNGREISPVRAKAIAKINANKITGIIFP